MNTVLITGAHGFLGRYTARYFKKKGFRVIAIGHGDWGVEEPTNFGIDQWIEADIDFATLSEIRDELKCVIHCAGGSSVGYSYRHPLQDFNRTVTSTADLLEYMRLHQPRARLIYPSSAAVYGKKNDAPIKTTASPDPLSPYGFHKKMAEDLCSAYSKNFNIQVSIIRFFSIYGAGLQKQLLWDACNKFSEPGKRSEFYGTGKETRDWIHITDAASLIYCASETDQMFKIINGGSNQRVTIDNIVSILNGMLPADKDIYFNQQYKEGDPEHYWADISGAIDLGWRPGIDIEEGLQEYVDWFKKKK